MANAVDRVVSPGRVVAVTAGLAAAGALGGALVADLTVASVVLVTAGPTAVLREGWQYLAASAIGAGCGALVGPLTAWTLLRHVPLGRAVLESTVGAAIGGALGIVLVAPRGGLLGLFASVLAGLALAVVRLRRAFPHPTA